LEGEEEEEEVEELESQEIEELQGEADDDTPLTARPSTRQLDGLKAVESPREEEEVEEEVEELEGEQDRERLEEEEEEEEEERDPRFVNKDNWQDKTWNEIVRLREEMFWARVGGVSREEA